MNTKPVVTGAITLALAVAGCGASSPPSLSAFKADFKTNKASFRQLALDLQKAITGARAKTDAQLATEIGALASRASAQASAIAKLNPPAKYKIDAHHLAAGFRAVATDLSAISHAAVKHDAAAAKTATVTLLHDAAKVKTSDDAITKGLGLPAG